MRLATFHSSARRAPTTSAYVSEGESPGRPDEYDYQRLNAFRTLGQKSDLVVVPANDWEGSLHALLWHTRDRQGLVSDNPQVSFNVTKSKLRNLFKGFSVAIR